MSKIFHLFMHGVRGLGMANDLRSVYRTNSPITFPAVRTDDEAARADAAAISGDWSETFSDFRKAFILVTEKAHV